jgi:tetratricopeptide (TPR) repeat protein
MHSRAVEGMRKTHGSDHPETLSAIDNLGSVFWHKFEFDKAVECHLEALKGMETKLGRTHERTLHTKENIALAYREIGGAYLDEAHELMEEVLEERTKLLGREQPYTLNAMSNLAYIKHTMGDHEEAERIIRKGLPVAERNLGEDHHGVLAAKLRLAIILTAQERYEEAKAIFKFLLDRDKYASSVRTDGAVKGYHAAWIFTFYQYVLFWEHQGKVKEALDACEELCEVLESSTHRIRKIVFDKREDLTKRFAFPLL